MQKTKQYFYSQLKLIFYKCVFLDDDKEVEIKKNELSFSKYTFLRKLVWWK